MLPGLEKQASTMAELTSIVGLAAKTESKLKKAGINSVQDLLKAGATITGRKNISTETGIGAKEVMKFVSRADVMRISGVTGKIADALAVVEVDSVADVRIAVPEILLQNLVQLDKKKKVFEEPPTLKLIESWISEAQALDLILFQDKMQPEPVTSPDDKVSPDQSIPGAPLAPTYAPVCIPANIYPQPPERFDIQTYRGGQPTYYHLPYAPGYHNYPIHPIYYYDWPVWLYW